LADRYDVMGFAHDHTRLDDCESFPYPVVHPIDVETEEVYFSRQPALGEGLIDVFGCDPCLRKTRRMKKRILVVGEEPRCTRHVCRVAVEEMAPPPMVDDEIRRHALPTITCADLDAETIRGANHRKQVEENAVFLELRVASESDLGKTR